MTPETQTFGLLLIGVGIAVLGIEVICYVIRNSPRTPSPQQMAAIPPVANAAAESVSKLADATVDVAAAFDAHASQSLLIAEHQIEALAKVLPLRTGHVVPVQRDGSAS